MMKRPFKLTWRNAPATVLVVALVAIGFSIATDLRSDQKDGYGRLYDSRLRHDPVEPKVPWVVVTEQPQAQPAQPVSEPVSSAPVDLMPSTLQPQTTAASSGEWVYEQAPTFNDGAETIAGAPAGARPLLLDGSTRERVSITGGADGLQLEVSRRDEMARVLGR